MENAARNAEIVERRLRGEWPSEIRRAMGLSRNVVTGVLNRAGLGDPNVDRGAAPNPFRILTQEQVREARGLYEHGKRGCGFAALGKRYGVSRYAVREMINGRTHKTVQ